MKTIIGIDPGTTESGVVIWRDGKVTLSEQKENSHILKWLETQPETSDVAIEMLNGMGMAVGQEVFETCVWIGRFYQVALSIGTPQRCYRRDIKMHFCQNARAKDPNIRQAIIDRFAGKDKAIGKKASQGPLYGVSGHEWQALAVALYAADTEQLNERNM
jgi:hypothetical protein